MSASPAPGWESFIVAEVGAARGWETLLVLFGMMVTTSLGLVLRG